MPWEAFWIIGTVILGLVLAWGMWQNHRRNRANDPVTEAATRREYDNPERYQDEQSSFEKKLKD